MKVQDLVNRNCAVWSDIHECIVSNNPEMLAAIVSKNKINLNTLHLSEGDNTILHSAAKSNNLKMIEFILQKISPSTKHRMLKMRDKDTFLPADYLRIWAPSIHSLFPLEFRQVVKAVLMLGAKSQDGTPYYPQTHFYKLPKDVLFIILQYAASGQSKKTEQQHDKKRKREETLKEGAH
jgi:hypothetical protein